MAETIDIQNTNEWLSEISRRAQQLVDLIKAGYDVGQSGELGNLSLFNYLADCPVGDVSKLANKTGFERGSNQNGTYAKFPDGTLICTSIRIPCNYLTADRMEGRWNYPHSFVGEDPAFSFVLAATNNNTANPFGSAQLSAYDSVNTSSSTARSYGVARIWNGMASFQEGDVMHVVPIAIGKYK